MKALRDAVDRLLRGPAACRLLQRMGINPRRFWLLTDLFGQLAERREMMSHLGRNTAALRLNSWILCAMSAVFAALMCFAQTSLTTYFAVFMAMTGALLLGILFSEAGNSLVNPVESLVLAHQPVDGATYTAAKLTHLARILLYLVPALDAIPALCGLLIGARWYYPLLHLAAAFTLGAVIALFCCAVFGWLIRFVPARRLKAVGQIVEVLPWTGFMFFNYSHSLFRHIRIPHWLPTATATWIALGIAAAGVSAWVVILGLRCLSGDYLVRVSAIVHGSSGAQAKVRRSLSSDFVARLFGGPPSRAGFEFVSRMMRRDWQFRRQLIPIIPSLVMTLVAASHNWRASPFSRQFTGAHLVPHYFGFILFFICPLLMYGSDYKGSWLFLLAPGRAFGPFAHGIYAWLWLRIIVTPHLLLLLATVFLWGIRDGVLFTGYSLAAASVYLSLELRLIEGMPFSKPVEPTRQNYLLPIMALGGIAIAIVVALQYFVLFHSPLAVVVVTIVLAIAAYFITRSSLDTFESSIRFHLGILSREAKVLYTEIDA